MDGKIDLITLIFLAIAFGLFFKLRSVLGRRSSDEDQARIERFKNQRAAQSGQGAANDKVVTLPRREREEARVDTMVRESDADRDARMTKFAAGNAALASGLIAIAKSDPKFDPAEFMKGARAAYEMIVTAFAEGNRKLLADLLSPEVYEGFAAAISDRESRKQSIEQSIVGISSSETLEAEIDKGLAQVTVKFVCDLINATRSADGEVVGGDPKRIKEVTDVWTFARDVSSSSPNWKLVATQAAG